MHTVPFTIVSGIILVAVTTDEQSGYFAFDTGAMQTAVNKAYFPKLQGEHIDIGIFSEEVKESKADKGLLNYLRFSDVELSNLPVLSMDLMYVENILKTVMPDIKLLGTLGIDIIGKYTVLLDYNSAEIILDPWHGFEHKIIVPMKHEKLPVIKIEMANEAFNFVLDTGANTCLLGKSFLNNPDILPVSEVSNIVSVPYVRLGTNKYENITAVISDISAIQKKVSIDGVIGYQILSQQRAILDFENNQLILEKASIQ